MMLLTQNRIDNLLMLAAAVSLLAVLTCAWWTVRMIWGVLG